MSRYIPFLKLKQGEILALSEIKELETRLITPFFEVPRDETHTESSLIKKILSAKKILERNLPIGYKFYVDNSEIDDEITINGKSSYVFLLNQLVRFNIIPVTGFDRTEDHHSICIHQAEIVKEIAVRITSDFLSGAESYTSDLAAHLNKLPPETIVTVILDYQLVHQNDIAAFETDTIRFLKASAKQLRMQRLILAGSSITASSGDMVDAGEEVVLKRHEMELISKICSLMKKQKTRINIGDYTTVSPDYSDVNLPMGVIANVMCPKISYSTLWEHYIVRGRTFRKNGWHQYRELAHKIINFSAFRGESYSTGDAYIVEKSRQGSKNGAPSAMVRHTVNAHMEMMLDNFDSIFN